MDDFLSDQPVPMSSARSGRPGLSRSGPCVRWECVDPERGHRKFYELSWVWCLFPRVERRWGRIGTGQPHRLTQVFDSPQAARGELLRLVARRKRRGYVVTSGQDLFGLLLRTLAVGEDGGQEML